MKVTEQAQRFWKYLTEQAAQRNTPSYAEAAKAIGYGSAMALVAGGHGVLRRVYVYCERNQLPLLPAIVVRTDGSPNERYKKWPAERDEVWDYDWSQEPVPSEDDFVL